MTVGRKAATMYELFGQASYMGKTGSARRTADLGDGRRVTIEFNGVVDATFPINHPFFPGYRAWNFTEINVVESSGGFNTLQIFNLGIAVSAGNPRAAPYGLTTCGVRLRVESTSAVQPIGRSSALEYEILGDQQLYPVGHTQVAEFTSTSNTGATATIIVRGTITTRPDDNLKFFPGQTKAWDATYEVDPNRSHGAWTFAALIEKNVSVSSNNPFREPGSTVGVLLRVLSLTRRVVPPGFSGERVFEELSLIHI